MKNYLSIWIGSRGLVENVEVVSGDVESMVKKEYDDFVGGGEDEYVNEFSSFEENDWGWVIGLGEEDSKYFIDMSDEKFIEWKNKISIVELFNKINGNLNEISDSDIDDLICMY
jgi:hypothetical protein